MPKIKAVIAPISNRINVLSPARNTSSFTNVPASPVAENDPTISPTPSRIAVSSDSPMPTPTIILPRRLRFRRWLARNWFTTSSNAVA